MKVGRQYLPLPMVILYKEPEHQSEFYAFLRAITGADFSPLKRRLLSNSQGLGRAERDFSCDLPHRQKVLPIELDFLIVFI